MSAATQRLPHIVAQSSDIGSGGTFYPKGGLISRFIEKFDGINLQSHRFPVRGDPLSRQIIQGNSVLFFGGIHGRGLLNLSQKTGQNPADLRLRDGRGVPLGQNLTGGILGIRGDSQGHRGPVNFRKTDQKLNKAGGPVQADR